MHYLIVLAVRSAWNRRYPLTFTLLSIALATSLLLGVERLRQDVRESFSQSVSGTDLVVGARASPIQLMLYAVFRPEHALDLGAETGQSSSRSLEYPALAGRLASRLSGARHFR